MYPLECYRCGKKGDASEFLLPRQCPDCASYEVHHPDAERIRLSRSERIANLTNRSQETS